MRNVLTFVAVALVTALTVALVAPPFIDWSARRQMVAHAISARIGASVEIDGPITLRLLPTPYLQVADVKVGPREAPWLQGPAMRFEFAIGNLIEGKIRLDDVVFDHPQIRLGPALPEFAAQERLEFGHIRAVHAEVRVERPQVAPLVLHDLNFDAASRTASGIWRGGGDFAPAGDARAAFQIAAENFAGETLPFKADIEWLDARAEWDGRLTFGDSPSFAGALSLSGVAEGPENRSLPWRVVGEIDGNSAEAMLSQAKIRLGSEARSLEGEGRLAIRFRETLELDGDIRAKTLNFDALLRDEKQTSATPARAARAFAALAQKALRRDAKLAKFSLKIASATAYLGARPLENPRLALSGAAGEPLRIMLETNLPGHGELQLEGGLELGAAPVFQGRVSGRVADFTPLALWVAEGEPALKTRLMALGAALPLGEISASGDLELSPDGYAARNLRIGVVNSHFDGGLVYRLPSKDAEARLFLDLSSDALDIEAAPNVMAGLDWLGDTGLDFRLKARKLRIARVGLASVESGSLDVHALKVGQKFTLDKLTLADFGGASIQAEGETAPNGRWMRIKLDAGRLSDFAALLARAAPNPVSRWLLGRVDDLGAVKATFEARRDGAPATGSFPLDFLKADGVIASSRFNLTVSRAPAPVDALSVQIAVDSPDTGALLRKFGAKISPAAAGRGELSLSGIGQWDRGFEGKARLALAGSEATWSGVLHPKSEESWFTGPLQVKASDLLPAFAALGLTTPGTGAVASADLTASMQIGPNGAHLTKLAGAVAGSRVAGELFWSPPTDALLFEQFADVAQSPGTAIKAAETPPSLTGALEFDRASLPVLVSLALGRPNPIRPGAFWPEGKFGPPLLRSPSFDVALKVAAFETGVGLGRSFTGRLRVDRDRLVLDNAEVTLNGGEARGRLELRRDDAQTTASGAIKLQNVGFERPNGRGRLGLTLDFAGAGSSVAALVGGLAGAGRLELSEAKFVRFDPEALTRAFSRIGASASSNYDPKALEILISGELDKGPLTLSAQKGPVSLSSGTLRFGPFDSPVADGSASVAGEFRLSEATLDLETKLVHAKVGRYWSGPPPTVEVNVRNALDAPSRKIDVALLSAGFASEAIARETERLENFEADVRERAMFNRRRKAELFLARREAEIAGWEAEQERRRLMERYIAAYETWAASRNAEP